MPLRFASTTSSPGRDREVAAAAACLDDAARARAVLPLHRLAQRCRAAYVAAEARAVHARDGSGVAAPASPSADLEPAAVAQRVQQAARDAAAARALAPREAERLELAGRLRDLEARRLAAAAAVSELAVRAEAEPRRWRRYANEQAWPGSRLRLPDARRRVADAERRLAAGRSLLALRNELVVGPARPQPAPSPDAKPSTRSCHPPAGPHRRDGRRAGRSGSRSAAAARSADPITTPTRPLRPPTRPTPRPRRRCAAGWPTPRSSGRPGRPASALETQAAVAEQAAGTDDTDLLDSGWREARAGLTPRPGRPQTACSPSRAGWPPPRPVPSPPPGP